MNNAQVAGCFEEMAILLELSGDNPFRIRAYQRAAQTIESHPTPVCDLSDDELLEISGIGKGMVAHIGELRKKDCFPELEQLRKRYPKGLVELIKLPGLGPKRAKILFERLKIDSTEGLRIAAMEGKLRTLAGFGPKLEDNLLKALSYSQEAGARKLNWEARLIAEEIMAGLREFRPISRLEVAGSLRRGKETVGDIDILCTARDGQAVIDFFTRMPQIERVMGAGPTKATVWLKSQIQCDLRVVKPESFGAALQYFTGSKDHNVALRELAQKKGLTINEYGLFRVSDQKQSKPLAGKTEEEIYRKLGMQFIPPELRENRGEIDAAQKNQLPALIELKDIRGDFHNHSDFTDGRDSLADMAAAAEKMGWEWVGLADHSRSLRVARGLSVDMLRKTIGDVRKLQEKMPNIRLMRSMEVDILKDGTMDYPDSVLEEIDFVIGSVHSSFNQPEEEMTGRIQRAIANPHVDMIGHLSGRRLGKRQPYSLNLDAILHAAAKNQTAVEINGQPERQDILDTQARHAKTIGIPMAVTTDAHSANQYRYMELAVVIARRAWLTRDDLLNCLSYKELRDWLK